MAHLLHHSLWIWSNVVAQFEASSWERAQHNLIQMERIITVHKFTCGEIPVSSNSPNVMSLDLLVWTARSAHAHVHVHEHEWLPWIHVTCIHIMHYVPSGTVAVGVDMAAGGLIRNVSYGSLAPSSFTRCLRDGTSRPMLDENSAESWQLGIILPGSKLSTFFLVICREHTCSYVTTFVYTMSYGMCSPLEGREVRLSTLHRKYM